MILWKRLSNGSKSKRLLLPNTIVCFQANYIDDDGQPAKLRKHLVAEVNQTKNQVILLKITSQWKRYFQQAKLGDLKCLGLNKPSVVNLNRIIELDLSSLEKNIYRKFQVCLKHKGNCVEKEKFVKIIWKLNKFWKNELNRDKKIKKLSWKDLK